MGTRKVAEATLLLALGALITFTVRTLVRINELAAVLALVCIALTCVIVIILSPSPGEK